jgi:hypothetical protein
MHACFFFSCSQFLFSFGTKRFSLRHAAGLHDRPLLERSDGEPNWTTHGLILPLIIIIKIVPLDKPAHRTLPCAATHVKANSAHREPRVRLPAPHARHLCA